MPSVLKKSFTGFLCAVGNGENERVDQTSFNDNVLSSDFIN